MAGIGSGLDAQFGVKIESVVGTGESAVTRFYEITDADPTLTPTYIASDGIRAGARFRRIAQVGISKVSAGGTFTLPFTKKNMGYLFKPILGSVATAAVHSGGTLAFDQIHKPGALRGISFTSQVGKPEPATGTVVPFTYNGCKVTDWEIDIADGSETMLKFTVDAWNETSATALTAASYIAGNDTWNFADVSTFKIGGTPTTAAGLCSIAGGSAIASVVTSFTLKGTNTMAIDRYGVGNAGIKAEQLETDFCAISGDFSGEFNKAQFYDHFQAGDTVALQIDHVGEIIETATHYTMSIIVPAAKITDHSASVSGPGLVSVSGTFTAYDDEVNAPVQIYLISTDVVV